MNTFRWAFNQLHHENLNESLSKPCCLRTYNCSCSLTPEWWGFSSQRLHFIHCCPPQELLPSFLLLPRVPFYFFCLYTSELGLKWFKFFPLAFYTSGCSGTSSLQTPASLTFPLCTSTSLLDLTRAPLLPNQDIRSIYAFYVELLVQTLHLPVTWSESGALQGFCPNVLSLFPARTHMWSFSKVLLTS